MRVVAIVLAVFALVAVASASGATESDFRAWMKTHNKVYANSEEFALRFKNFVASHERLAEHSELFGGKGAKFTHNKFSDMAADEFDGIYKMQKFDSTSQCIWPFQAVSSADVKLTDTTDFDWRDQTPNPVTEVKDQAQCGSCWAFSTTGNIEGQWILGGKNATTLSEQQLVDCSTGCLASEPQLCDAGCGGGLPWLAYGDIISWGGITDEESYPYTGYDGSCQSGDAVAAKISSWQAVTEDTATIQSFLQTNGPLSVTLNANPLMSYSSGVITGTSLTCPGSGSDHAVLLVGFGVDNGVSYWTVKNSWGTSWGEQGFFRMESDVDICGLQDCVTTAQL